MDTELGQIKRIIEALLFASSTPLTLEKIKEITDLYTPLRPKQLQHLISILQQDYITQDRAFRLEETAQGFLVQSIEEFRPYIDQLYRNKRMEKLSPASTEVLAIIAYKQPITRQKIDAIRGVDSSGALQNLLERHLIQPVGKQAGAGRPILYGITKSFLFHFGLRDLSDLPQSDLVSH